MGWHYLYTHHLHIMENGIANITIKNHATKLHKTNVILMKFFFFTFLMTGTQGTVLLAILSCVSVTFYDLYCETMSEWKSTLVSFLKLTLLPGKVSHLLGLCSFYQAYILKWLLLYWTFNLFLNGFLILLQWLAF